MQNSDKDNKLHQFYQKLDIKAPLSQLVFIDQNTLGFTLHFKSTEELDDFVQAYEIQTKEIPISSTLH